MVGGEGILVTGNGVYYFGGSKRNRSNNVVSQGGWVGTAGVF